MEVMRPQEGGANITENRTSQYYQNQTPWGTYTGRSTDALNAAIYSDGYIQSGLNTHFRPDMMMNGAVGTQLAVDPEFHQAWPPAGSGVYDNSGGGKTTITRVVAPAAPNSSSYQLTITYDGTGTPGTNPTPGFAGIYQGLEYAGDGNPSRPGRYAKFTKILYKVWAHIPVGRTLEHASNSYGTEGTATWLTSQAGTGDWALYEVLYHIGWSGSFSSIGHLYVAGGSNTAFSWHIAKYDQIDITSAPSAFTGHMRRVNNGAVLGDATLVTGDGTSAYVNNQSPWVTDTTIIPGTVVNRTQYLDGSGNLDSLSRISSRGLNLLTGRTADNLTYVAGGATVESLRPGEAGANVTETRTALYLYQQQPWATYSGHTPSQIATPVSTYLTNRTQQNIVVGAGGDRWFRVARVVSSGGRGAARVTLGFDGGGVTPSAVVMDVSSDWSGGGSVAIVSNGYGVAVVEARLSKGSGEAYLDVRASMATTNMMIDVEPLPGTSGVWAVHYVDGPTVGATLVGNIPLIDAGGNRATGVMTNGTYTLISSAGGVNTNGVAAVNSSGVSYDVTHGADRAVLERGANITENRTSLYVYQQSPWVTDTSLTPGTVTNRTQRLTSGGQIDFAYVEGSGRPANNATVGAVVGTNLYDGGGAAYSTNRVLNDRYEGGVKLVQQPDGGQFNYSADNQVGQLEIVLPFAWNVASPMITFDVVVHDYSAGRTSTYTVAGHHYNAGSNGWWANVTATFNGPRQFSRQVRFGYNAAGKATVWIGSVGDLWQYPNITIRNVQIGYASQGLAWESGWTVGLNNTAISGTYVNMTTPYAVNTVAVPRSGDHVFGEGIYEAPPGSGLPGDNVVATRANTRTDQGTSAYFANQTDWATYTGINTTTMAGRTSNLDSSGNLDSLSRVTSRGLSLLTGRTADNLTYVAGGATVESLRPGEAGANVTESRTAAYIANQQRFATATTLSLADADVYAPWSALESRPAVTQGDSLTEDPAMADPSCWVDYTGTFTTVTDGRVARTVFRGTSGTMKGARHVPVDRDKTYMVEGWYRSIGAHSNCYGGVDLQDGSGNTISEDGTFYLYSPSGATITNDWTYFSRVFGAGTSKPIPTNGRQMRPLFYPNYNGAGTATEVQGLRIVEVTTVGGSLRRADGTVATEAAVVTSLGTSQYVSGQTVLVTNPDFAGITGATRPANNAGTSGTLTVLGSHTTAVGNFVQKSNLTGTHGAWQGGVVGPSQRGSCFISGSIISAGLGHGWLTCYALDDDGTTFVNTEQRYNIIVSDSGAGTASIYMVHPDGQTSSISGIAVTTASRAKIAYDGSSVKALIDGVVYHSVPAPAGLRLWPKMLDYYQSQSSAFPYGVVDIQHGAFTENTAAIASLVPYNSETVVSGSTATKVGGSHGAWGGGVSSRDRHTGSAFCSFRVAASAQPYFMAGLANSGFDGSYNTIQYSFYTAGLPAGNDMRAYAGGIGELATLAAAGAWALTDVWSVVYDGVRVQWLQNGVVRYTYAAAAGQTLGFAASQVYFGNQLADIQVGPAPQVARLGQNTYDDSGGALVGRTNVITSLGTALYLNNQGSLATANTISTDSQLSGNMANRLAPFASDYNYLRADRMVYANSVGVENLRPGEAGANVTETRTANYISGQTAAATAPDVQVFNNRQQGNVTHIDLPVGGSNENSAWGEVGAWRIVLPVTWGYQMISFDVHIQEYGARGTVIYSVYGYAYADGGQVWINSNVKAIGDRVAFKPVYMHKDPATGRPAVDIGLVSSSDWHYSKVSVKNVRVAHSPGTVAAWETGWTVTLTNSARGTDYYSIAASAIGQDAVFGENSYEDGTKAVVCTLPNFKTSQGTSAYFNNQQPWATATVPSGLTPAIVGDRTQRLNNSTGVLDSLSSVASRDLSLLDGRTADKVNYVGGGGVTMEVLRPQEAGANVTESRTALYIANQSLAATTPLAGGNTTYANNAAALAALGTGKTYKNSTSGAVETTFPTASGFGATANYTSRSGSRSGAGSVTTGTVTITPSGATGSVTYNWYRIGGDDVISATSPTGAATAFTGTVGIADLFTATFACAVSDSGTGQTVTLICTAAISETT